MLKVVSILILILFCLSIHVTGAVIHVPSGQPTIQAGINAASTGDIVLVAPGTYMENIDFFGKAITVQSSAGPDLTIIDGSNPSNPDFASVVLFNSGEGPDSVVEGFTLKGGTGLTDTPWDVNAGGGIYCDYASPTIRYNVITGNTAGVGAGIVFNFATPVIHNCTITGNTGGGLNLRQETLNISRCIIWNNPPTEIWISSATSLSATDCCIKGGYHGVGNIDANPWFCNAPDSDYHLAENSPCAADQHPSGQLIGALGTSCGPETLTALLSCTPSTVILPSSTHVGVKVENTGNTPRIFAGNLALTLADGHSFPQWRQGLISLAPNETQMVNWNHPVPAYQSLVGSNSLALTWMDITPPPFNQPPYPANRSAGLEYSHVTGFDVDSDVEVRPIADAYVRGDQYADVSFGTGPTIHVKNTTWSQEFMRKGYIAFDIEVACQIYDTFNAILVLDLSRVYEWGNILVFGITDNVDWNPEQLPETRITYNNAPHNDTTSEYFTSEGNGDGAQVRQLGVIDATTLGIKEVDITSFVRWGLGLNPGYGFSPADDDRVITILLRGEEFTSQHIPGFRARENTGGPGPMIRIQRAGK